MISDACVDKKYIYILICKSFCDIIRKALMLPL